MRNLVFLVLLLSLLSCKDNGPDEKIYQGTAFGTTFTIRYFTKTDFNAIRGIDSVVHAVNKSVSTYMPNSDISKINKGDSTVVVDAIFKEVYRVSETVYTNSKGFFDPTIGVLRNAYGFGDEKPLEVIDSLTLDSLRQYVGFRKVQLNGDGTIQKKHPQIYFDFNAVAKGYGIDLIGAYLEANGVDNYLIELGGELLAKGRNLSKDKNWIVGVEATTSQLENRSTATLVTLENKAMAASGNYRKFRIDSATGKKYVHTINPHTGKAEQSDVTSATVIAPSCVLADAYATAFMAMGLKNATNLVASLPEIEAYITYADASGDQQTFVTEGFQKLILE